ncbi:ribonuclease P protein component [Mesonia sp. HuA40]|uniref:ribonuclease P protein component n=1 Tax=Mesonia sp. HuA40 TaxID=2602761 RepID=UPI0011CB027F|nr:ribonuclease P protein component [Mesonia sp. HuA40]TXK72595.1 ribonuclease P protein component [Mesonia sp. HuA40]
MKKTLGKDQRLKSKTAIKALFENGETQKKFPLRMVYKPAFKKDQEAPKIMVSVPKRNFKLAVDRNRIKRQIREAYRLQKDQVKLHKNYNILFIFLGNRKQTSTTISKAMQQLLIEFNKKV